MPLRDAIRDEKAARLTQALLANVDNWEQRTLAIADALPLGDKRLALSLALDIRQVKCSLSRLIANLDAGAGGGAGASAAGGAGELAGRAGDDPGGAG